MLSAVITVAALARHQRCKCQDTYKLARLCRPKGTTYKGVGLKARPTAVQTGICILAVFKAHAIADKTHGISTAKKLKVTTHHK